MRWALVRRQDQARRLRVKVIEAPPVEPEPKPKRKSRKKIKPIAAPEIVEPEPVEMLVEAPEDLEVYDGNNG